MSSKEHVSKTSFSELLTHFVLSEATARIKIFSFGSIEDSFVLQVLEIVFEVLCSVRVEETHGCVSQLFFEVVEGKSLMGGFELVRFAIWRTGFVDEDLSG